jgi:polyhydroxybutyrate depolymerase
MRGTVTCVKMVCLTVVALSLLTSGTETAGAAASGRTYSAAISARSSGCGRSMTAESVAPGHDVTLSISTDGIASSYQLTVPRSYRSDVAHPLILLFYGWMSNASQFSASTGLPADGAGHGYLVAVPSTPASEWQLDAHGTDADRVDAMVRQITRSYCVDQHRIYASGFSAGAAFAIVYSCARPDLIAAIATAAVEYRLGCTMPMSVLAFHGTQDAFVPYQNGAMGISIPGVRVRGTQLNMRDWARLDGCHRPPTARRVGAQVQRQVWPGCRGGTSVVLYTIVGGGHAWPGADGQWVRGVNGPPMDEIDATALAVDFFGHHRLVA